MLTLQDSQPYGELTGMGQMALFREVRRSACDVKARGRKEGPLALSYSPNGSATTRLSDQE